MLWKYRKAWAALSICCFIGILLCRYQANWLHAKVRRDYKEMKSLKTINAVHSSFQGDINALSIGHTEFDSKKCISTYATEQYFSYLQLDVSDRKRYVSVKRSKVELLTRTKPLKVGDRLKVRITLFDMEGRPADTGGEYLRIWLRERGNNTTNVNGYTVDHGNGTYTGELLLPWKGYPEVFVSIGNTKEHISLVTNNSETYGLFYAMIARFVAPGGRHSEITHCSPLRHTLRKCAPKDACDLTMNNYGLPWFCCKPNSLFLKCEDFKSVSCSVLTDTRTDLLLNVTRTRKHMEFPPIPIVVEGIEEDSLQSRSVSCHDRPKWETWEENTPSGYYRNHSWINLYCKTPTKWTNSSCFAKKRFALLGDSNSRGIFLQLASLANAVIGPSNYTTSKKPWHELLTARNVKLDVDLMWAPHNSPFYVGGFQSMDTMQSVGRWLDRTPNDKPIIVLINLYSHLARASLSIFKAMVRDARAGIIRLFDRAPNTAVVIQGPHAMTYYEILEPIDYLRRCYEQIWYEEFKGIHEKVIYLDYWDMTAGSGNVNMHPSLEVQSDYTKEVLAHVCPTD